MRYLLHIFAALALFAGEALAQVAPEERDPALAAFVNLADALERQLDAGEVEADEIEARRAQLEERRAAFTSIAADVTAEMAPLQEQLAVLGTVEEGTEEAPEIAAERTRLTQSLETLRSVKLRAEQSAARASLLAERLNSLRRTRFAEQLLQRQASPLNPELWSETGSEMALQMRELRAETRTRVNIQGAVASLIDRLALPLVLAIAGLFLALVVRRWLVDRLKTRVREDMSHPKRVGLGVCITLARLLLPAVAVTMVLVGLGYSGLIGPKGEQLIGGLAAGAMTVIAAYALSGAFFAPSVPLLRLSRLDDAAATGAQRWLVALAAVVALDEVLVASGRETGISVGALSVLNAGLLVMGGVALWRFLKISELGLPAAPPETTAEDDTSEPTPTPQRGLLRLMRLAGLAVAVVAPLLALAGFYGASRFVFYPLVYSGALIGVCVLVHIAISELARARARNQSDAELGAEAEQEQGVSAVPVFSGFLLMLAAAPLLALIWGATVTDLAALWALAVEGFELGEVTIAPVDFLMFIIVFAIGYLMTRMVQGVLRRSVMPVVRLDEGAKSAALAGIGYVGITISALVAISATGLDLSNLAIVAGALSVGIGFGLQNIVNNFVSGIILLIERPIKTGDWVEIGGVHGTVRKVNVRSTEIQTFDRSTMFVPNADLISGTVTNWTHADSLGRLIVPVGVAYGTDARRVEKVLLEIAQAHPMLMRRPAPYVVFVGFGADSIDFEIRGVLRDVNWILNVGSDIRFSVYEKFAEEGIEIPFAQRDVHIKNFDQLKRAVVQRGEAEGQEETPEENDDAMDPDQTGGGAHDQDGGSR